ncbi:hypothetical protein HYPBUDRAFT_163126 [Hyphopichia burtonii NRRL Y-1933]|uniref:Fatty acid hydroxylase domain-containing protein n=1 Tax=Hyphopichia burtonii NRRL Y-1933 TaxID=984485 RepID=A0A1E4RE88_9ASCO|nr:hypothetical protein HYPBUDRAFT_163126 [Hyphopichia burtonii NRRL Y-1933]ODV65536.1 hypothetical protein HYPBUDRAFT_163126 [Hyphopichia burtonii NRRL Y-1933]
MDIVLEVCDTFFLDKVYAKVLPRAGPLAAKLSKFQTSNGFLQGGNGMNSTNTLDNGIYKSVSLSVPLPLQYIWNMIDNFQDKDEIYGLVPKFLNFTEYTDESILSRSNIFRVSLSTFLLTALFGWILYFAVASISYLTVFDKNIFNHPRYLKNQMSLEIHRATTAIPTMVLLTLPFFLLELRGFSRLYFDVASNGGWKAIIYQFPMFILFTDCGIYFIHRWLHWPSVYKKLHKPHHKWIVCTPFASHAFHPVDGWAQSLPYHLFPLFFKLHKVSYLFLFTFVNFWTVMIHDGQYLSNDPFVNGTACHTVHHLYFNYNYGQFTTLWDRLGSSYRRPDDSLFARNTQKQEEAKIWKEQTRQMEEIRGKLEGKTDDRVYGK